MRINYTGKLSATVLVFMMFAVSRLPAQSGTGPGTKDAGGIVYNTGDTGPAGGIVFYDKGVYMDGWRYLEAAPAETEFRAEWGAYGKKAVVDTGTEPGSGMRNTEVIAAYLDGIKESDKAAQQCRDLSYGGFDDWFLPCKDELDLMYKNLKAHGLGGFGDGWYWYSSEGNIYSAYQQRFKDGLQLYYFNYFKNNAISVRAACAF